MKVLVDTSVWSAALRRSSASPEESPIITELKELILEHRVVIIGPIRQEILSGIKNPRHFEALREKLRAFQDSPLTTPDYESAAESFNRCRENGIQGSHIDFLIVASAENRGLAIFTTDRDFSHYAEILGFPLHEIRKELLERDSPPDGF